jgi:hypothetical protein
MTHTRSIGSSIADSTVSGFNGLKSTLFVAILISWGFTTRTPAQQHSGGISITPHKHDLLSITSRDYWMAFPGNYGGEDDSGKYIMIYISCVDSTTAYIEVNGETDTVAVVPGTPVAYSVPLVWEMLTSDIVENKAVHVWSNDASLFVDFNSHDAYTSDASYVIPSAGWGETYVIAAYESLNESLANGFGGDYPYDYPSEFVIVSNQDSTNVTITPSKALRSTRGDSSMVYPAGIPFKIMMSTGQAVQYEAVPITDTTKTPFDVTGTQIVSSNPVGVIGASSCANIPVQYPYCDFACEMIPPIRTWGQTYYTAPLYGRVGGDTYVAIGTQAGQVITRTDATGSNTFATLTNAYDHAWTHSVANPSSWTSDAPFLLIQYSNSSTWPNGVNGNYDPFMMAINSVDHFSTPVIFNVLHNSADQTPYFWHADIIARSGIPVFVNDSLLIAAPLYDDGFCAVYQLDSLRYRQYIAASDSGVSVSVYGDGFDEAVGYSGMIGVSTTGSSDTLAPQVAVSPVNSTRTTFSATKSGSMMSGLSEFEIDFLSNMQLIQAPNFVEGNGRATGSFDLVVTDPAKAGHGTVRVLDMAGNYTTVVNDYSPSAASVATTPVASSVAVAPNPAGKDFTIQYVLGDNSFVTCDLFDLLGNRVLSLVNGNQAAGSQTLTVDTHLLPNGAYVYRLDIDGTVQSGNVVVSR